MVLQWVNVLEEWLLVRKKKVGIAQEHFVWCTNILCYLHAVYSFLLFVLVTALKYKVTVPHWERLGKVRYRNSNRLCTCISSCHTFRNGIKLGVKSSGQFWYDANLDCHYSHATTHLISILRTECVITHHLISLKHCELHCQGKKSCGTKLNHKMATSCAFIATLPTALAGQI